MAQIEKPRPWMIPERIVDLPGLVLASDPPPPPVPDEAACISLWDRYGMLPNIRAHSHAVARVALDVARRAAALGHAVDVPALRAAALLHDLAKTYTILHGGAHAQLGAAWVREETGRPDLAQAVLFHVSWPWIHDPAALKANLLRLPLLVSYADKRVRHDKVVSLEERFDDLLKRYGDTGEHRASIRVNREQAFTYERALSALVGSL